MDDAKKQVEDIKCKAKSFMKNFGLGSSSSRPGSSNSQAFRGQGHRLGGSAEPSPAAAPARKLGPGFKEQQQQNDLRRLQQERWARERGVAPAQPPYHQPQPSYHHQPQPPYHQPRDTTAANPLRSPAAHVIQSGGTLASAAASVRSAAPDDRIRVERESRGTVQVGNLAPPAHSPHFDPYSPIIATGTSHRPAISGSIRAAEPQGQFQCPICQKWWQSEAQVSSHIDDCTGVHTELEQLSIRRREEAQEENARSPAPREGHVIEDLDDAVAIFLSGGPSNETIQVLLRVFRTILNAPNEEKYRTLKLSKPKIKETIASAIGGLKFCESVGFRLVVDGQDKSLLMERPSAEKQERIQAAVAYLDSYNSASTPAASLDSSLPSAPPLPIPTTFDRKLRVFYAASDRAEEKFEVPDSFFNRSAAELRNEAAARRKKIEDSQMLIPKSWREKQAAAAKKRYRCTVVRVQLPDGLLVQGFFKPGEPTSSLYEFVASTLKDPSETFDLILPAGTRHRVIPRFPDAGGQSLTMEDADLVPKALLKFNPTGPQGYTCLTSECYSVCEPL